MKYHISVKFFAIVLAAVFLAGAAGSALGIITLVGSSLYSRSVEDLYEQNMEGLVHDLSVTLAHRYASTELGNVPQAYWEEYGGTYWLFHEFDPERYVYCIRDWEGNTVFTNVTEDITGAAVYESVIEDLRYRQVLYTQDVTGTDQSPTYDSQENIHSEHYYDYTRETMVRIDFRYATLGKCTVTVYLLDGAYEEEPYWELLRQLYAVRYDLLWVLGVSVLLFAVSAVYLCCAAGRKPGSEEIRAGGLNRIPLDLYLGAAVGGEFLLVWLCVEGVEFLLRNQPKVLFPAAAVGLLLCSLILVVFCYAGAAQLKMKHGFWWRHSVIGWVLRQVARGLRWVRRCCRVLYLLIPMIGRWLLVLAGVGLTLLVTYRLAFGASYYRVNGFFVLMLLLELAVCAVGVVYCAYAFGVLLGGARKMAQGNLEEKIPTRHLYLFFLDLARELNRLADAARISAQKQLKSERMKTELITNVSHDIKTPLTSIINYVDLLEKPHTEAEGKEYLEVLSRQSLRLKKLLEDLMDMSRASTGNVTVEPEILDAAETVNQALGEFGDKLAAAGLTPVVRLPEQPVRILADGKLVWRVMSNLLGNAVKYALPGTRLYIDLIREKDRVLLSLKNISREELNVSSDELTERFVRGDASRNTEGSGLGLNIAQSLMELQKGSLELTVDGDLFKVTLVFPAAE